MEEEAHQRLENDDELVAKPAKIYPIHSHSFYSLLPTLFTLLPFFSFLLFSTLSPRPLLAVVIIVTSSN